MAGRQIDIHLGSLEYLDGQPSIASLSHGNIVMTSIHFADIESGFLVPDYEVSVDKIEVPLMKTGVFLILSLICAMVQVDLSANLCNHQHFFNPAKGVE